MNCWDGNQTDQSEILDDGYHIIFTLVNFAPKVTLL